VEPPPRWVRAATLALCILALLAASRGLVRHNTWYLASDQFAFLTFADDLTHGRVFHDPTTIGQVAGPLLPRAVAADAYYQTYIYRDGRLYSRYPPGYPLLLAGAKLVGGEAAAHALNPLLYLVLLVVLGVLAGRLGPPGCGSATAAATMWALLVIPVEVHYWGITVVRDLPAHLLALTALLAATAAAPGCAGLLLGFAASIRPDAVLWGPSIALVLDRDARRLGGIARGTAAFVAGVLPILAYNTVTQGHPLAFTQGGEFTRTFESGLLGWPLGPAGPSLVQGGAFRLANFASTFPVHVRYLAASFGMFVWLAIGALIASAWRRLPLARAVGPYAVIGLLFYSCWSHGDPRYLVGVSLSLIVLAAIAVVTIAAWLADARTPARTRLVALAVVVGVLTIGDVWARDPARGLTALERTTAVALAAAAATAVVPRMRGLGPVLPALAFALFGAARIATSAGAANGYGGGDVARARADIESVVPRGSLVLSAANLGRPAENWTHYTHADALYLAELPRLVSDANYVTWKCTTMRRPLFFLLGANDPLPLTMPPSWARATEVARREGDAVRDWFVDPQRAPSGVVLYSVTLTIIPPAS
jgi:hypothetical protein